MRRLLVAVLVVMLALPVAAEDGQKGLDAYDRGDYATALRDWRPLAEQGFADAQYNLGVLYGIGRGVPQDYGEAVKWWHKAAEQGYAPAQALLGAMYKNGKGVPQDCVQALMWFNLSAAQGQGNAAKARDIVAERMTPADITKPEHLAREWLEKHRK